MSASIRLLASLALAALCATAVRAAVPLYEGDLTLLELDGDLHLLQGLSDMPLDGAGPRETGAVADGILRLVWRATFANRFTIEVHDRLALRSRTAPDTAPPIGLGTTRTPPRSLLLRSELAEGDDYRLTHDVDRLVVGYVFSDLEIRVGRQAIDWAAARVFPVTDLWARYSPWDLDRTRRRGVDAVRVQGSPAADVDLELVVADLGGVDHLSAVAKARFFLRPATLTVLGGKVHDELILGALVEAPVGPVRLYGEALAPFELGDGGKPPRVTAGLAASPGPLELAVEGHFNGDGTGTGDLAGQMATSEPFRRGEVHLLGRWYAGLRATWSCTEALAVTLRNLTNPADPSAVLHGELSWRVQPRVGVHLGAFGTFGARPVADPEPTPTSEFGRLGQVYYVRSSIAW